MAGDREAGQEPPLHNDLGPGHREATYHNAMSQRFVGAGLAAEREPELPIPPVHILAHRRKRWQ